MDKIETLLKTCDLFVSIGTSGVVYPAAGFVQTAKYYGATTIEINLDMASNNFFFDKHIYGKAGLELPKFIKTLL
jgi:NAD-dependent deacetylase